MTYLVFVYFLSEVILRTGGGATGAFATGAFDPEGFHTRGGAAFNLGSFLSHLLLHRLSSLYVVW